MSSDIITNILKIRDDNTFLELTQQHSDGEFSYGTENIFSSWIPKSGYTSITKSELRQGIEPWLTSLFQSEHLSLLVGTGLSTAIESIANDLATPTMLSPILDSDYSKEILESAESIAYKSKRGRANIEDYIRVINDLLRGLEILGYNTSDDPIKIASYNRLNKNLEKILTEFTEKIRKLENKIASSCEKKQHEAFDYLVSFLMSFASRTGTRERLNIFTTNYDRLIEAGSEIAGLHLIDRFIGNLTPIFRASRLDIDMHYNPPGIRGEPRYLEGVARFTKLHGSIDWIDTGTDIRRLGLPFGSEDQIKFSNIPGMGDTDVRKVMVYPNASKDRETTEYPYVELFRDFASALCRPNSTLITYGYGFGDDHINRIIRDMLTIPSTHLVMISYDEVEGRIIKNYREFGRPSQISLIVGNGVANLKTLVDYFLPKPSIDRASIRMSELLKQRYSTPKSKDSLSDEGEERVDL